MHRLKHVLLFNFYHHWHDTKCKRQRPQTKSKIALTHWKYIANINKTHFISLFSILEKMDKLQTVDNRTVHCFCLFSGPRNISPFIDIHFNCFKLVRVYFINYWLKQRVCVYKTRKLKIKREIDRSVPLTRLMVYFAFRTSCTTYTMLKAINSNSLKQGQKHNILTI